jgi:hypothetical protein
MVGVTDPTTPTPAADAATQEGDGSAEQDHAETIANPATDAADEPAAHREPGENGE